MGISVFLADDNLLVREGVRALIDMEDDLDVVGVASDYDELVAGASAANPQVVVTDIRMPPTFRREGIDAAHEVRRRHPGTGVVILSQYDDPEYAIALLSEGAAGYAYLLKDRVAEGDQLARAIREVATGGSVLDATIVTALTSPVAAAGSLSPDDERLLAEIARGAPIKAIALSLDTTPADVDARIERLWMSLAENLSAGDRSALERLKSLQRAIADREEQGETLSRLLPAGIVDKIRADGGRHPGATEELEVTVLIADIRGYSTIAEHTDPSSLAAQLNRHRAEMNAVVAAAGGTVMQFVGDAIMAVFGAPIPLDDHASHAVAAARSMHAAQARINEAWASDGLDPFGLGIGVSTGPVAAALLGSDDRLEYTVIGDTVNLSQRIQQWAESGETVLSVQTFQALDDPPDCDELEPAVVKGRTALVSAFRFPKRAGA